jgi:hypothetical protein
MLRKTCDGHVRRFCREVIRSHGVMPEAAD